MTTAYHGVTLTPAGSGYELSWRERRHGRDWELRRQRLDALDGQHLVQAEDQERAAIEFIRSIEGQMP